MEKLKRYFVFLIGLFINSLGVILITKADLGTSPHFIHSICAESEFPFYSGPVYNCVQPSADRDSAHYPAQEL